jgi:hypothetical protein
LAAVPKELHNYSNYKEETAYTPDAKQLVNYQIVCMLFNSGRLLAISKKSGSSYCSAHFTHILIDECDKALHPTALVTVVGIPSKCDSSKPGGQLILAETQCNQDPSASL